jgi:hypothetical protein
MISTNGVVSVGIGNDGVDGNCGWSSTGNVDNNARRVAGHDAVQS